MQKLDKFSVSELILMVREGHDEAFSELVHRYLPMLEKVTGSFVGVDLRKDEAFCEASVAFYKAAMTYDISRSEVTFGLYARICVKRRMLDLLRRASVGVGIVDIDLMDYTERVVMEKLSVKLTREIEII